MEARTSSFVVKRANSTTFCIKELDRYREHPLIYAKIHPSAPIVILSDTGCNSPAEEHKHADFTRLKPLLEEYPVSENNGKPLNPDGKRSYVIIISHCHYDHIGGIEQFSKSDVRTQVIASAAGRDFIESDLAAHSLCKHRGIVTPDYKVTHWAQAYERLTWPLARHLPGDIEGPPRDELVKAIDLEIDIIQTPGHTPDELAWADVAERTIYVGDTFYQLGGGATPIIFPPQGNMFEWLYSLRKIGDYVLYGLGTEPQEMSTTSDDWTLVSSPVRLSAAHETVNVPAHHTLAQLMQFCAGVCDGTRPALYSDWRYGEVYTYWCSTFDKRGPQYGFALWCPRRLVEDVQRWLPSLMQSTFEDSYIQRLKRASMSDEHSSG